MLDGHLKHVYVKAGMAKQNKTKMWRLNSFNLPLPTYTISSGAEGEMTHFVCSYMPAWHVCILCLCVCVWLCFSSHYHLPKNSPLNSLPFHTSCFLKAWKSESLLLSSLSETDREEDTMGVFGFLKSIGHHKITLYFPCFACLA